MKTCLKPVFINPLQQHVLPNMSQELQSTRAANSTFNIINKEVKRNRGPNKLLECLHGGYHKNFLPLNRKKTFCRLIMCPWASAAEKPLGVRPFAITQHKQKYGANFYLTTIGCDFQLAHLLYATHSSHCPHVWQNSSRKLHTIVIR